MPTGETPRLTIEEYRKLLRYIADGYDVPKIVYDTIFDIAKREVEEKERVVLAKRDPDVHAGRIQAFYVKVIEGNTIDINPAITEQFGADHDGDTFAVFAPLSQEAQEEAKRKMIRARSFQSMNSANFSLSKEILTGIFTLTYTKKEPTTFKKLKSVDEAYQYPPTTGVEVKFRRSIKKTTAGRIIFNNALPEWFPFVNEPVDKKLLNKILKEIILKDENEFVQTLQEVERLGFYYSTIYPKTISIDDFELPPSLIKLKQKLIQSKNVNEQLEIINQMEQQLLEYIRDKDLDLYYMVASGAAKDITQLRQIMVCKGLVTDANGNILPPIRESFLEGYTAKNYFNASAGARKGIIDRSLNTAEGGYLYRKTIYIASTVEADMNLRDCGTNRTLNIKMTPDLLSRMEGRYLMDSKRNISRLSSRHIGKIVPLRSPIYCKSPKICTLCYGDLIFQLNTENIGIVAPMNISSLSEKIMKCSDGIIYLAGGERVMTMEDFWNKIKEKSDVRERFGVECCIPTLEYQFIRGKDGYIPIKCVERHKPSTRMVFINIGKGFLFCQENHPIIVKRDLDLRVIPASEVVPGEDEIFVDTSLPSAITKEMHYVPDVFVDTIVDEIANIYFKKTKKQYEPKILVGDNKRNYRLPYELLFANQHWVSSLLYQISNNRDFYEKGITSYYLFSQLVFLCNRLFIDYHFDVRLDNHGYPVFYLDVDFDRFIPSDAKYMQVKKITFIESWDQYVYDIKTCSEEFMINNTQTHNSFHLGGAVEVQQVDLVRELLENLDESDIKLLYDKFTKKHNEIYSNDVTVLTIDKEIFLKAKTPIKEMDDHFELPLAYFTLSIGKHTFSSTVEREVKIWKTGEINQDERYVNIVYQPKSKMMEFKIEQVDYSRLAIEFSKVTSGRSPWFDVPSLFMKFYKKFGFLGDYDLVHLEVFLSVILRWRHDPQIPARLKEPYDPVLISEKKLPPTISWLLGLAFEDFNQAIRSGLVSNRSSETAIEKAILRRPL